jgi:hypothetical protein
MDIRDVGTESSIANADHTVAQRQRRSADLQDLDLHIYFVTIDEGRKEIALSVNCRKSNAMPRHQLAIADAELILEELFHRDMGVMENHRVIDKPSGIDIAKSNFYTSRKGHGTVGTKWLGLCSSLKLPPIDLAAIVLRKRRSKLNPSRVFVKREPLFDEIFDLFP